MAKIGVFTFFSTLDNYGQVLQCLATQVYLKQRGHESVVLVNRLSLIKRLYISFCHLVKELKNEWSTSELWEMQTRQIDKVHPRGFDEFRKKYFCSVNCTASDLSKGVFDAVVVGSDQTWACISDLGFLNFSKGNTKKIALAPSLGPKLYSAYEREYIKPLLEDFDILTCREDSGVELCKSIGLKAELVLDPTFLLNCEDYRTIESHIPLPEGEYIFLYLLGADISMPVSEIYEFAYKQGLKIVYVASQGRTDDFDKEYPSVGQWLYILRNARYVVTNSFHGMAMSIIYGKDYLVLPIVGEKIGMNERFVSLSSRVMLSERIIRNNLAELLIPIDFSHAEGIIKTNKELVDRIFTSIEL